MDSALTTSDMIEEGAAGFPLVLTVRGSKMLADTQVFVMESGDGMIVSLYNNAHVTLAMAENTVVEISVYSIHATHDRSGNITGHYISCLGTVKTLRDAAPLNYNSLTICSSETITHRTVVLRCVRVGEQTSEGVNFVTPVSFEDKLGSPVHIKFGNESLDEMWAIETCKCYVIHSIRITSWRGEWSGYYSRGSVIKEVTVPDPEPVHWKNIQSIQENEFGVIKSCVLLSVPLHGAGDSMAVRVADSNGDQMIAAYSSANNSIPILCSHDKVTITGTSYKDGSYMKLRVQLIKIIAHDVDGPEDASPKKLRRLT